MIRLDSIDGAAFGTVIFCWCAFALVFVVRKKPPKGPAAKRATASLWGIAMLGVSYALVWSLRRDALPAYITIPRAAIVAGDVLAMALAVACTWLTLESVRTLGKQWSIEARLVEGHRLIVAGPYSHMRHPIYTAMLGMLVATGLVVSVWWGLLGALALGAVGTAIRVQAEEKLLREEFGEDFLAYRRYVPALIPRFSTRPATNP
jgi:protein-S-isoprenylcysteine O-methyltransferase Ste14